MKQYVSINKNLNDIKQKFIFNLTKRQFVCFGIGIAMGLPVFFLTKDFIGLTLAVMLMAIVAAPAFICAIYQKNGLFFEQTVKNMIYFFKNPRIRTYQSENIYIQIQNEIEYMKLKKKLQRGAKATNGRIKKISAQKNKAVKRRN